MYLKCMFSCHATNPSPLLPSWHADWSSVDSKCWGALGHSCGTVIIMSLVKMLDEQATTPPVNTEAAQLLAAMKFAVLFSPPLGGGNYVGFLHLLSIPPPAMAGLSKGSQKLKVMYACRQVMAVA